jgi:alanine-synthesizing transaminase
MLLVQGTGFNWPHPDHLRIVFLPNVLELTDAMQRLTRFLDRYSQ